MFRKFILGFGVVLLLTASALAFPAGWWLYNNFELPDWGDDKPDIARADIKHLETKMLEHYKRRGFFPETLPAIMERDPIDDEIVIYTYPLVDPWGENYRYDWHQLHPTTGVPLIWSEGRPGRKKRITNWD